MTTNRNELEYAAAAMKQVIQNAGKQIGRGKPVSIDDLNKLASALNSVEDAITRLDRMKDKGQVWKSTKTIRTEQNEHNFIIPLSPYIQKANKGNMTIIGDDLQAMTETGFVSIDKIADANPEGSARITIEFKQDKSSLENVGRKAADIIKVLNS